MDTVAAERQPAPHHLAERIDRWLRDHRADLVARVRDLVAFPTLSPPGRNTAAAQEYLAAWLASLGCAVESFAVYPGDPDVVGRWRGAGGDIIGAALVMGSAEWLRYEISANGVWIKKGVCTPPDDAQISVSLDGVAAMQAAAYLGVSE